MILIQPWKKRFDQKENSVILKLFVVYSHNNLSDIINNYHFRCHNNDATVLYVNGVLLEKNYDATLILTTVQLHTSVFVHVHSS